MKLMDGAWLLTIMTWSYFMPGFAAFLHRQTHSVKVDCLIAKHMQGWTFSHFGRFLKVPCRINTGLQLMKRDELILGINKYSHDVSCAIVSAKTGDLLFMTEKERVVRRKHAAGDCADLVEFALASIQHEIDDVKMVIQQNHHWRVAHFEERLPWACALEHYPPSYMEEASTFASLNPSCRHELSHHLAHAWSVFPQAPFERGLIVVMDGMGEQQKSMALGLRDEDFGYTSDLYLPRHAKFMQVPAKLDPLRDYREAESAYYFDGDNLTLVFKRYTMEASPSELYNHGFENMESIGAVYSRISSHIFGDWNACGKVMGLSSFGNADEAARLPRFMEGNLASETFRIDWKALHSLPQANEWHEEDEEKTKCYAHIARRVQEDLENVAMSWIRYLKQATGAANLCICGGVGQNSVLNGRIIRELGFEDVFIPPYPGDEGISIGCALWGFAAATAAGGFAVSSSRHRGSVMAVRPARRYRPLSPYQGKAYSEEDIEIGALATWSPFLHIERKRDMSTVVNATAHALADGKIVAWFQGRSECGPRALGHRSLLADPRNASMHAYMNKVKKREAFRPFAPSVLAEAVSDWFEVGFQGKAGTPPEEDSSKSPFMSCTLPVSVSRRNRVPAICHVDGTARLQTVRLDDDLWYYRLLKAFFELTGVPMLLNTSFNTLRAEPIVETPSDAIRSFLATEGAIDMLVMGCFLVKRRPFPLDASNVDYALCVVCKAEGVVLEEVICDAETGSAHSVRVARGSEDGTPQWIELEGGELDLVVWQFVDGFSPIADIMDSVLEHLQDEENDTGFHEGDVVASFRRLYSLQLILFKE